ncbi:MAG TPA: hypothetical protein VFQ60_01500 [Patescibacteria group bacterium]|nr:hypothetical protein [Patescibacteria group bacterium]
MRSSDLPAWKDHHQLKKSADERIKLAEILLPVNVFKHSKPFRLTIDKFTGTDS